MYPILFPQNSSLFSLLFDAVVSQLHCLSTQYTWIMSYSSEIIMNDSLYHKHLLQHCFTSWDYSFPPRR